jgi:cysteine desulfurase
MTNPIYLDYNGTTPHDPEVIAAMRPYLEGDFGNPSSSHWYGIRPKQAVETARRQTASLLGCAAAELIFTSGGTESNNQALKSIGASRFGRGNHLITSQIEHPAVLEVCRALEHYGFTITYLPVDGDGLVDPEGVAAAITPKTIMISIMHANNEVGALQPIAEIAGLIAGRDILLHTDAAQSVGKVAVKVDELGVDLLSVAGHKLYGPKGVGVLYIRQGVKPEIFCHGAGQERGIRAGTENVMGIAGLGQACDIAERDLAANIDHMRRLRDRLEEGLDHALTDIRFNGHRDRRLPNTASVSFLGIAADRLLEEIGLEVAASAGAACHSDRVQISHVLAAMGLPEDWAKGTLRFSTGRMTTAMQIDRALEVIVSAVKRLRGSPS